MKKKCQHCATPEGMATHLFIRVSHMHHAAIEGRIMKLGFHHSQHRMLMHLARYEHIPSQKELAEAMGITPAAVTTTLKRLEREGYITRTTTDEDNRRNEIRITEAGLAAINESRALFDTVDHRMFKGISDEELTAFIATLERMRANLGEELPAEE
ncbi:MAG: MarR family transcriptional regulator [Ruminococcaceae bacterium]|nr:MarR family transcriptional regulator [Oscillospiraceae bacterium]